LFKFDAPKVLYFEIVSVLQLRRKLRENAWPEKRRGKEGEGKRPSLSFVLLKKRQSKP